VLGNGSKPCKCPSLAGHLMDAPSADVRVYVYVCVCVCVGRRRRALFPSGCIPSRDCLACTAEPGSLAAGVSLWKSGPVPRSSGRSRTIEPLTKRVPDGKTGSWCAFNPKQYHSPRLLHCTPRAPITGKPFPGLLLARSPWIGACCDAV
jgi:hypothetical protein